MRSAVQTVLLAIVLLCAPASIAVTADGYPIANGATVTIDEHGTCRQVTNNHTPAGTIYVHTAQSVEWSSFLAGPPSGVAITNCIEPTLVVLNFISKYWYTTGHQQDIVIADKVENIHGYRYISTTQTSDRTYSLSGLSVPGHTQYTAFWMAFSGTGTNGTVTPRRNGANESGTTQFITNNSSPGVRGYYKNYTGQITTITSLGLTHGAVQNKANHYMVGAIPGQWVPTGTTASGAGATPTSIVVNNGELLFAFSTYTVDQHVTTPNHINAISNITRIYSRTANWFGHSTWSLWLNDTGSAKTVTIGSATMTNPRMVTFKRQ